MIHGHHLPPWIYHGDLLPSFHIHRQREQLSRLTTVGNPNGSLSHSFWINCRTNQKHQTDETEPHPRTTHCCTPCKRRKIGLDLSILKALNSVSSFELTLIRLTFRNNRRGV